MLGSGSGGTAPFPGFYAPAGYFLVTLQVFAVFVIACAVAAEHLGAVFERMYANLINARAEAQRGQDMWTALIEQLPVPALLVDADTSQVICAERAARAQFLRARRAGRRQRSSTSVIRFSYPEVMQQLVGGFGGTAPLTMIHVGNDVRVTDVRVQHVSQRGRRFALLLITDATDAFIRRARAGSGGQRHVDRRRARLRAGLQPPGHVALPGCDGRRRGAHAAGAGRAHRPTGSSRRSAASGARCSNAAASLPGHPSPRSCCRAKRKGFK